MSYYIKHKKNYWDRKVFNKIENFDTRLLKYSELNEEDSKKLFKKYVELVCLEMSYYCNRACNYCPVYQLERDDKNLEIPTTIFDSVLSSLKEINYDGRISLNLFNEPLASKNIYTNIAKIHKKLPNVTLSLNSNGDYIKNLDTLKKLEKSGLKEILITLHTPKDKKWNRSYNERRMKIIAKKIKFSLTDENIKNLQFSLLVGKLYVEVYCTDWNLKGNSRGGELENLVPKKNRINPCEKPIREFIISYDGTVQLCCHVYHNKTYDKYTIAKIDPDNQKSIFKIYAGKALTFYRRDLFDYSEKKGACAKCNHYEDSLKTPPEFFTNPKEDLKKRNIILDKIKNNSLNKN